MPLPALLAPALTAIATYGGYQATQTVGTMAADVARENLKEAARLFMVYMTTQILNWSCADAREYLNKYCADKTYYKEVDCSAMVAKQIAACGGSVALTALSVVHAVNSMPSNTGSSTSTAAGSATTAGTVKT